MAQPNNNNNNDGADNEEKKANASDNNEHVKAVLTEMIKMLMPRIADGAVLGWSTESVIHSMEHWAHKFVDGDKDQAIDEMAIVLIRFTREVYKVNGVEYHLEYIFDDEEDEGDDEDQEDQQVEEEQ